MTARPRALVTGGAGFIGSHLSELLLASGYDVTVVDNLSTGRREQVPVAATFIELDITGPDIARVVREGQYDVILHHAGQMNVRKSVVDPVYDEMVNVVGTLRILEAVRTTRRPVRVVFASTGGVLYGDFVTPPTDEAVPKDPESPYGVAKLSAEYYLAYYARVHGLDTIALRYGTVYGPRQDPAGEAGVVAIFCDQILDGRPLSVYGDGRQTRDFIFVHDVTRAALAAVTARLPTPGRVDVRGFNIGTGVETSVRTIADTLLRVSGATVPIDYTPARPGDQQRAALKIDKAAALLGWRPTVALSEGLATTYRFFAEQHARRHALPLA